MTDATSKKFIPEYFRNNKTGDVYKTFFFTNEDRRERIKAKEEEGTAAGRRFSTTDLTKNLLTGEWEPAVTYSPMIRWRKVIIGYPEAEHPMNVEMDFKTRYTRPLSNFNEKFTALTEEEVAKFKGEDE